MKHGPCFVNLTPAITACFIVHKHQQLLRDIDTDLEDQTALLNNLNLQNSLVQDSA